MTDTHIWMLDRIRENQHLHTEALRQISERQKLIIKLMKEKPSPQFGAPTKWIMLLLKPALQSAAQWAAGILALAYVLRGGDVLTAMQTLLKLF